MRLSTKLIFYNLTLLLFLTLPLILASVHGYRPVGRYLLVNDTESSFPYLYQQIYERKEPIDVLLLGSSILWSGIDASVLEKEMDKGLGRKTNVVSLAWNYVGLDLANLILRDVTARRQVRLIVSYGPGEGETPGQPHPMIASFLQYDQARFLFPSLNFLQSTQLYGALVLGAPRQIWGNLRPPAWQPSRRLVNHHGTNVIKAGYQGKPYVEISEAPPPLNSDYWRYRPDTAGNFEFQNSALPSYENSLLKRLAQQAADLHIPLVMAHIPRDNHWGYNRVVERQDWTKVLPGDVALMGATPERLFDGRPVEWIQKLYYNEHLNRQGAEYYTRAMSGTLIELFREKVPTVETPNS